MEICKVKRRFAFYMIESSGRVLIGKISNRQLSDFLTEHYSCPFDRFEVVDDNDESYNENSKEAMAFLEKQI